MLLYFSLPTLVLERSGEILLYFSLPVLERQGRGGQVEELPCRKRRDAVVFPPSCPREAGERDGGVTVS
jgi:hypothetical protein